MEFRNMVEDNRKAIKTVAKQIGLWLLMSNGAI
jgi:hypothetical protein